MTLYDYAHATHQSRSVASKDLRQIVAHSTSGITIRGSHSHKVWIAKNEGDWCPHTPMPKHLFGKEIRKKKTFSYFLYNIERNLVYLQR